METIVIDMQRKLQMKLSIVFILQNTSVRYLLNQQN